MFRAKSTARCYIRAEGKARQGGAGQGKTRQAQARQSKTGQGWAGQGRAGQGRAGKTRLSRAGQGRVGQDKLSKGKRETHPKCSSSNIVEIEIISLLPVFDMELNGVSHMRCQVD